MMDEHEEQESLFSYGVDLDRRVRTNHLLRLLRPQIDLSWVRDELVFQDLQS